MTPKASRVTFSDGKSQAAKTGCTPAPSSNQNRARQTKTRWRLTIFHSISLRELGRNSVYGRKRRIPLRIEAYSANHLSRITGQPESAAIERGISALESVLNRLAKVPTPAGPTPLQLRGDSLVQIQLEASD